MRKFLVAAIAVIATAGFALAGTASAGEGHISQHIVGVTKIVNGPAPDEAEFTVDVNCEGSGSHELDFGEEGGTQSVVVGDWPSGPQSCTISEPEDGGASDVTISPTECEFPGRESTSVDAVVDYPDVHCAVTVTNEFDEETTTTAPPPPPQVIVEQAPPATIIVAAPNTTG